MIFRFTTYMSTVGDDKNILQYEKIFAVIIMMVGALMHATIFGHVTNIVQRSYARRSEYNSKWSDLKQFTEVHNVPKQLKQRMQDYFQSVWSINHGIDVTEVIGFCKLFVAKFRRSPRPNDLRRSQSRSDTVSHPGISNNWIKLHSIRFHKN